jgi:4-hydroxy-tetrahydrodipicolinate reductase
MADQIRIAIAGALGRMGRELIQAISASSDLVLVGGADRPDAPGIGQDLGVLTGGAPLNAKLSAAVAEAAQNAQVLIDFSTGGAAAANAAALSKAGLSFVIGATGYSAADEAAIADAATRAAILKSGNMSLGVTLLAALTRQAAARLGPDWDIEIVEAHHRRKVDAPSGTALLLGQAAAEGRKVDLKQATIPPRDGHTGPRPEGGIGYAVLRVGGVVGEHEVWFAAEDEIVKLSHHASDRRIFAKGALAAARFIAGKKPGLYGMADVLGL